MMNDCLHFSRLLIVKFRRQIRHDRIPIPCLEHQLFVLQYTFAVFFTIYISNPDFSTGQLSVHTTQRLDNEIVAFDAPTLNALHVPANHDVAHIFAVFDDFHRAAALGDFVVIFSLSAIDCRVSTRDGNDIIASTCVDGIVRALKGDSIRRIGSRYTT
ncbi:hypothetical protein WK99_32895 [Burkholderia ubonensis]|nr:hypothetical protein WK99_32895 [Burkholderia ubonensis]